MRTRLVLAALVLAAGVPTAGAPAAAEGGVWAPTLAATQGFDHLSAFADGTFYAQYLDSYAKSTDHGRTWTVMPKPTGHYYGANGIRFATPAVGYAVGGAPGIEDAIAGTTEFVDEIRRCGGISPLRRTDDGGTTWRAVCVPRTKQTDDPRWAPHSAPLALANGGRTVMLSGYDSSPREEVARPCGDYNDVLYTSHDAGAHWTRTALPRGWYGGHRQAAYDSRTLARLTYGGWKPVGDLECGSTQSALFLSRDGGRSFRRVLTCGWPHSCTSVAFATRDRIVVGRSDGSTLRSENGGRTWRFGRRLFDPRWQPVVDSGEMSEDAFWVQGLSFADARHGYASTRGSGTWRTADGGLSWTQEKSPECAWYLPGVGEVAAGTGRTAITGGPHFISARAEVDGAPPGCGTPEPQAVAPDALVASGVTAFGRYGVRADGSATLGR